MPWKEEDTMSLRYEFVVMAMKEEANIRELCRRFGICPRTGYKWIGRFRSGGKAALADQSRRPRHSPNRTDRNTEEAIVSMRDAHPPWGGRKKKRLERIGYEHLPAPSTISGILKRNGRIELEETRKHTAWKRFESPSPNALWQMDFKGDFAMKAGRCYPLTVLDDNSRYSLGIKACRDQRTKTVTERISAIFRRYGLPKRILCDYGTPWAATPQQPYTAFSAWLIRLGINITHGRPGHPQTQGKEERFHRSLQAEVIDYLNPFDLNDCQKAFDGWREVYNNERPHEALDMDVPADRYTPSTKSFPEDLPPIQYPSDDIIRKVQTKGEIYWKNRTFKISKAFRGMPVAIRPTPEDGLYHVYFCNQKVAKIDLKISSGDA